jgi:hypothetical protein
MKKVKCAYCNKRTDAAPLDDGNVLCDRCREELPKCSRCGYYTAHLYLHSPVGANEDDPPVCLCGPCCNIVDPALARTDIA